MYMIWYSCYVIWYSQYVIWYGCILTLGGCTSSKHHKYTYYHSLTQFYRLFLQYNSLGFKKYRGSYGSTLYKEGKLYEQIHVKKPSLAFWPKTHFVLFLPSYGGKTGSEQMICVSVLWSNQCCCFSTY